MRKMIEAIQDALNRCKHCSGEPFFCDECMENVYAFDRALNKIGQWQIAETLMNHFADHIIKYNESRADVELPTEEKIEMKRRITGSLGWN